MQVNPVIIFGASGLGRVALDIFKSNDIVVYGFLDDDAKLHGETIDEVPILGSFDDERYTKLIGNKCDAFVAAEDAKVRRHLVEMLAERRKVMPINAIHASATIAPSARLQYGTLVGPDAIINSAAQVGDHCLINAGAIVDYAATLADYVQLGTGAVVGSSCQIAQGAFVGTGATVVPGLTVGKNARIGAGSVVIETVSAGNTVFGNPAKKV